MRKPDDWAIKNILNCYAATKKENEKKYYDTQEIDIIEFDKNKEEYEKLYIQAMRLVFTNDNYTYGDLYLFDVFIDAVINGYFIPYDGTGYYVDFDGNKLGYIN